MIKSSMSFDVKNVIQIDRLKPSIFWKYQGWRLLHMIVNLLLFVIAILFLRLAYVFIWLPLGNVVK